MFVQGRQAYQGRRVTRDKENRARPYRRAGKGKEDGRGGGGGFAFFGKGERRASSKVRGARGGCFLPFGKRPGGEIGLLSEEKCGGRGKAVGTIWVRFVRGDVAVVKEKGSQRSTT